MNIFVGSGRVSDAKLVKEGEVLKFLLVVDSREKSRNEIPCTIFDPSTEMQAFLAEEPAVELSGSVKTFVFDVAGKKIAKTEVVVYPRSLKNL
jgi:hypothetical protein